MGFRTELDQASADTSEMKNDLSLHTDELEKLFGTVQQLKTEVEGLVKQSESVKGHARRDSIRIVGLSESAGESSTIKAKY